MNASIDTLFLPVQNGDVPADGRTLFIGAAAHPALKALKADCWQPFKPLADTLGSTNLLQNIPADGSYDLVLINIPKQVDEAKHWIAAGLYALKQNGWLALAALNDANGARLEKWMRELNVPYESATKNKARVVWALRDEALSSLAHIWFEKGQKQIVQTGDGIRFVSQPGVFGWDKVDAGSQLLTKYLPKTLKNAGADFGAGTGYLSKYILENIHSVETMYLAEADARALECARENITQVQAFCKVEYLWADLSKPVSGVPPLDFIVMNPPFHTGKKTEATLGQSFIERASAQLKKGGRLYIVANAHLPYEEILREKFAIVRLLTQENGFKVFEAAK